MYCSAIWVNVIPILLMLFTIRRLNIGCKTIALATASLIGILPIAPQNGHLTSCVSELTYNEPPQLLQNILLYLHPIHNIYRITPSLCVNYTNTIVFCQLTHKSYNLLKRSIFMIGDRIRTLRISRNLNQVELAKKLNVSKQSVSNWENDNILSSVEIVKKLAEFFSCSTDYLLGLNDCHNYIEVQGLTNEQITHIQYIIDDIRKNNKNSI